MLTPNEIADLRSRAYRSQRRQIDGRRVPVTFTDGPLDDMKIAVPEASVRNLYLGFCVPTNAGVVQALYTHDDGDAWRFAKYERGGR